MQPRGAKGGSAIEDFGQGAQPGLGQVRLQVLDDPEGPPAALLAVQPH